MTEDLATALRAMADAESPHALDVERIVQEGRSGLLRRRMAALGGGTAALAAAGLVVAVLAPAGGAGHGAAPGATASPGVPSSASSAPTTAAGAVKTLPAQVNPRDPDVTHWQFGYLPAGMTAHSGAGAAESLDSTVWAYDPSGFGLRVETSTNEPQMIPGHAGVPNEKVPAHVEGAVKAFWLGYGDGVITSPDSQSAGKIAQLAWQLPGGQWLEITATHVGARADWQVQTLTTAAHVVRQDRSVPLPIKLAGVPAGFDPMGVSLYYDYRGPSLEWNFWTAPDHRQASVVMIVAFKTGGWKIGDWVPSQNTNTCEDSRGLTLCVSSPDPVPAPLTAIGGAHGLLQRITSLGNDPAGWTTDVLP
ncbi:MAG: hypothetical protein HOW97_42680 [Catenulispora sp.]|nr:hypothetical protein [Catenulispora sp.]